MTSSSVPAGFFETAILLAVRWLASQHRIVLSRLRDDHRRRRLTR